MRFLRRIRESTHAIVCNKLGRLLCDYRSGLHQLVEEDLATVHQDRLALVHCLVIKSGQSDEPGKELTRRHNRCDGLLRLPHRLDSRLDCAVQLLDRVDWKNEEDSGLEGEFQETLIYSHFEF